MPTTTNLEIDLLEENQSLPEVTTNAGTNKIDGALTDLFTQAMADSNQTVADDDALSTMFIECTGALTATRQLTLPVNKKIYFIKDSTTGGFDLTVIASGGAGFTVSKDGWNLMRCDGTDAELIKVLAPGDINSDLAITITASNYPLTAVEATNYNVITVTGALTANRDLIIPTTEKLFYINNTDTSGYKLIAKASGQPGVWVKPGWNLIRMNGTDADLVYPNGIIKWDAMKRPSSPHSEDWELGDSVLSMTALGSATLTLPTVGGMMYFDPPSAYDVLHRPIPSGGQDFMVTTKMYFNTDTVNSANYAGIWIGEADGITNNLDSCMIRGLSTGDFWWTGNTYTGQPIAVGTTSFSLQTSEMTKGPWFIRGWYDQSAHEITWLGSLNGVDWMILGVITTPQKSAPFTEYGIIGADVTGASKHWFEFWRVIEGADLSGNIYDPEGGVVY